MHDPVRFGILGAAKIAPKALILPAREGAEAVVVVVGARDRARAEQFAQAHGIARVGQDYAAVLADPEVDVVYNALPMSLHAEWTLKALAAGKHVLCEKPFAANAAEARRMVDAARAARLSLVEAMHYRYHPLFERVLGILASGVLGPIQRVSGRFTTSIPNRNDLRHLFETAGGATMDLGCYPLHWLRQVMGAEPRVVRAEATLGNPHVDVTMSAELVFPSGVAGSMFCSMADHETFATSLEVVGERGMMYVDNPMAPQFGHRLDLQIGGERTTTQVDAGTSYRHQLVAFVDALRTGRALPTGGEDAVANMQLIDAVYRAAGLPIRGTSPS